MNKEISYTVTRTTSVIFLEEFLYKETTPKLYLELNKLMNKRIKDGEVQVDEC